MQRTQSRLGGVPGASSVIDYQRDDFTTSGCTWDVIFDTVTRSSFARCKPVLNDRGRYLLTDAGPAVWLSSLWTRLFGRKRLLFGMSVKKHQELEELTELLRAGVLRPIIDRTLWSRYLRLMGTWTGDTRKGTW